MKLLLLLLAINSVTGFGFFVLRSNGAGLCITDEHIFRARDILAIPNLSEVQWTDECETRWTDEWRLENLTLITHVGASGHQDYRSVPTDGSSMYRKLIDDHIPQVLAVAQNATFLFKQDYKNRNSWRGDEIYRMYVDHFEPGEGVKHTWLDHCFQADTANETCHRQILNFDKSGQSGVFHNGERWTQMRIIFKTDKIIIYRENEPILQWTRAQNLYRYGSNPNVFFARTHQLPGLFKVPIHSRVEPIKGKAKNRMSRTLGGGDRCITICWRNESYGHFSLLNSDGEEVQKGSLETGNKTFFANVNLELRPGPGNEFRLELLNITNNGILYIGPCVGTEMKLEAPAIRCTWTKPEYAAAKEVLKDAQFNADVKIDLSADQLSRVCRALGFNQGDVPEPVKFCNLLGCNFKNCSSSMVSPLAQQPGFVGLCQGYSEPFEFVN